MKEVKKRKASISLDLDEGIPDPVIEPVLIDVDALEVPGEEVEFSTPASCGSSIFPKTPMERSQFDSINIPVPLDRELKLQVTRLMKYAVGSGHNDHEWKVRTWDDETATVQVRLICLECGAETGGGAGDVDKSKIVNMFVNFRNKHWCSRKHEEGFAKRRNIDEHLVRPRKEKSIPMFNHRHEIDVGVAIVARLNMAEQGDRVPFVVDGDTSREPAYAHGHRVRCVYCGNKFELVPKQKNLEHNLNQHLGSQTHINNVEAYTIGGTSGAIRSGKVGRPKIDRRDMKGQLIMTELFPRFSSAIESTELETDLTQGTSTTVAGLSLLCWGYWFDVVTYQNKEYDPKPLLLDQKQVVDWYSEPQTRASVYNPTSKRVVNICGVFRHIACCRISILGGGFEDLVCSACYEIVKITSFRLRLIREGEAAVPRGSRTSHTGLRLGYLQYPELIRQAQEMGKNRRKERFRIFVLQRQICAMRTRKCKLSEMLGEAANRKDLLCFLRNICAAHSSGAFGGKEALWSFLDDLGRNLNRKHKNTVHNNKNPHKGNRFSKNTRALAQALFHFGGRQVAQVMQLNLLQPSLRTLRREKSLLVPFQPGVHAHVFAEIGRILEASKAEHGIIGDVPVVFAEDETRIRPRVRWEAKRDTLIGFCGDSEAHVCSFGLEVVVGNGEVGYNKIFDTFQSFVRGSYARVVIVNPLHDLMPKLAICVSVTCNCFKADWVRKHWEKMKLCWDAECRDLVGPLIGHASDGDGRRRKLMLEDMSSSVGQRFSLGWVGWVFSGSVLPDGDVEGLGDQDPPHNGKKLVNPLDRSTEPLVLGEFHATLAHLYMVYKEYKVELHGLRIDDVVRKDRQNWAGPQRLASRKVLKCLRDLGERADEKRERTLGTEIFMEMVGDYIDIHYSLSLTLYERVVMCGKVSFFFRLWRLWLRLGNHFVAGSTNSCSEKNMISRECFSDVQISMHFVVLLCCLFRDKYPTLPVPLHLVGSDACENFFSKVGGMRGYERNYDFCDLLDCASGLNRIAALEYGSEKIKLGKHHAKQETIWGALHPLAPGQLPPNLCDFSGLQTNDEVIQALKVGLCEAQDLLIRLQMAPHSGVKDKTWFKTPWLVEADLKLWVGDRKVLDTVESRLDFRTLSEPVNIEPDGEEPFDRTLWNMDTSLEEEVTAEEDLGLDGTLELNRLSVQVGHVFADILNESEPKSTKVEGTVTFEGQIYYKSTLVSQLAGNPTLSKDRLTRIKQSVCFNGVNPKPRDPEEEVCILDIGSDCGVLFDTRLDNCPNTRAQSKARKGNKNQKGTYVKEIWYGRVQAIRRKQNGKWGKTRTEIDLLDRPNSNGIEGAVCEIRFNWYTPLKTKGKFVYDTTDLQWINLDMVISTVTMNVETGGLKQLWILHPRDKEKMDEFLADL